MSYSKPRLHIVARDGKLDIPPAPPTIPIVIHRLPPLPSTHLARNREIQIAHWIINAAALGAMTLVSVTVVYFMLRGYL